MACIAVRADLLKGFKPKICLAIFVDYNSSVQKNSTSAEPAGSLFSLLPARGLSIWSTVSSLLLFSLQARTHSFLQSRYALLNWKNVSSVSASR